MNERATDDEDDQLPIKAAPEDPTLLLAAEVIVSQNSPAECTVFPPDATDTAGYNHVEIFDTPWCRNIPRSYSR
jgi:hypothetical protein